MHVRYLFVHLRTGTLSSRTIKSSIRSNNIIHELANGFLVFAVGLKKYIW